MRIIDIYRINETIKTAKIWTDQLIVWFRSTLDVSRLQMVGFCDAAYGSHQSDGKSRLGYIVGLSDSIVGGQFHPLCWASRFTRKTVKSSLGGEIYSASELMDHMGLLRECVETVYGDIPPQRGGCNMKDATL